MPYIARLIIIAALFVPWAPVSAQSAAELEQSFVELAGKVRPSVVVVICEREVSWLPTISNWHLLDARESSGRLSLTPETVRQKRQKSAASGFVIDDQGHIVTAASALNLGGTISVGPPGQPIREAEIVGIDELANVAVLRTLKNGLVPAPLDPNPGIRVGQWVVSVANPYGLTGSVTIGTVSGKDRYLESDQALYFGLVQITNPINPGEMGGALVDLKGKVVGMLSFSYEDQGRHGQGRTNVNFAIPLPRVLRSARQIIALGSVRRAWLGVTVTEARDGSQGVVVVSTQANSPASGAGVRPGDLILEVDGKPIGHPRELQAAVLGLDPDTAIEVAMIRGEKRLTQTIELAPAPRDRPSGGAGHAGAYIGAGLRDLTSEMRSALGVSNRGAVIVGETIFGSPAARTGIRPGDVVLKLSGEEVLSVRHCDSVLSRCRPGQDVEIEVFRDGVLIPLRVRLVPLPPGSRVSFVSPGSPSRSRTGSGIEEELFRLRKQIEELQREVERLREAGGD